MSGLAVGIQMGLELTKIFPLREVVEGTGRYALDKFLELARNLRNSGSDFLVEEDLADIFGRGRINPQIEEDFRKNILQDSKIIPIHKQSVLALSTGAGPTVNRAIQNVDRGYLATIIQLSFLGWMHERVSLASALDDCMNKRLELGIPGARVSPGYDGIYGMLEACSAQTSSFQWSNYVTSVKARMQQVFGHNPHLVPLEDRLPPGVLLACMDSLFIIQRTPEERILTISEPRGFTILVVWAHYILGLAVLVKSAQVGQEGEVLFSGQNECSPQVVIEWRALSHEDPKICLLDRDTEIILTLDQSLYGSINQLDPNERLPLRDYGTVLMCRNFGESLTFRDDPRLIEAVQVTVAVALTLTKTLVRVVDRDTGSSISRCCIQDWQVFDAASVLFHSVPYDENSINSRAVMMSKTLALRDAPVSPILKEYMNSKSHTAFVFSFIRPALIAVVMAVVPGIRAFGDLPIIAFNDFKEQGDLWRKVVKTTGDIALEAHDLFSEMCMLLVGSDLKPGSSEGRNVFMVSDFGWTLCLPSFGDTDPAAANPETLFIRRGVPTNAKTLEQKTRVRDSFDTLQYTGTRAVKLSEWIVERGMTDFIYIPRCISPVVERTEYYGGRKDGFHLAITFRGEHSPRPNLYTISSPFTITQSYRSFFNGLWETSFTPPCEHSAESPIKLQVAALGSDVATAAGNWSWGEEEFQAPGQQLQERIIVILVKGDWRARWLAVGTPRGNKKSRNVMLRRPRCCENCAVKAAAALPGRWLVII